MIPRKLEASLVSDLGDFPAVGLIGPRQVGKTTLAKAIAERVPRSIYLDLELEEDLFRLRNAQGYLSRHEGTLVVLDEIQRKPDLFPILRGLCDQTPDRNGRFLVLGSASPDLSRGASESLAGRILYRELFPFSLFETGPDAENVERLWLRGGYPDSFLARDLALSSRWRESFIRTFLERDIPQLGFDLPAVRMRRMWTMIAHLNGQVLNVSQIAASLGVSSPTVSRYLDLLEETFVIRRLPPWFSNLKKRLVKSPKIYVRDTGLLHRLLGIDDFEALLGHPGLGASWEGFCVEQILSSLPYTSRASFYRSATGNEVDLVIEKSGAVGPVCVEIKYSLTPRLGKGFYVAMEDTKAAKGLVVYPGRERLQVAENVEVVSLADAMRELGKE